MNFYYFENITLPNKSVKLTASLVSYIISSGLRNVSDEPGIISKKFPPKIDEDVILACESSGIFISLLSFLLFKSVLFERFSLFPVIITVSSPFKFKSS